MNHAEFERLPELDCAGREEMNALCTRLALATGTGKRILVTSCLAGEGKTFLAANIVRTLARLGHTAVLVDADLRCAQGTEKGLSDYLTDKCELDEAIVQMAVAGAATVDSGTVAENPLTLLNSPRLETLLQALAQRFEFVIVDSPAAGLYADAMEIARFCDGTVFAVKYAAARRKALVQARQQMERSGTPVLGAVFNGVTFETLSSRRFYNKALYARCRAYAHAKN